MSSVVQLYADSRARLHKCFAFWICLGSRALTFSAAETRLLSFWASTVVIIVAGRTRLLLHWSALLTQYISRTSGGGQRLLYLTRVYSSKRENKGVQGRAGQEQQYACSAWS